MAAPMPRAAPVTSAIWPASGRSQSPGPVGRLAGAPTRMTWPGHVRRRPESRKRSVDSMRGLGARRDVDQLGGGAAAELLADRAGEALQGALGGRLGRRGGASGGVPSTMTRPHGTSDAGVRVEEVVEGAQAASGR